MPESIKIPLAVDLNIEAFTGTGIDRYDSGITNGLVRKDNDKYTVTQRPGIDIFEDSTQQVVLNNRARGIYYWEENTTLYNVHDNDVYRDSYVDIGDITTGTEKVTILEGTSSADLPVLVVLDTENNEGWLISTGHALSDLDSAANWNGLFPTNLAYGGAILDGYLFVMDVDGIIYNSSVDKVNKTEATYFVSAEREPDKGVYLGKHHDHIVAFGTRTIELFTDTSNPTGSPITRRPDISYNIGCADGSSVWEHGDITFFVGSDTSGALGVYKLVDFRITKVSKAGVDSFLTQNLTQDASHVVGSGFQASGHPIYTLTFYILTPNILADTTLVFDDQTQLWGVWSTVANEQTTFPLIGWTKRTGGHNDTSSARSGEGVFENGDLFTVKETMTPIDTVGGLLGYFTASDTYIDEGYFNTATGGADTNIPLVVRTGQWDGGGSVTKIQNRIKPLMKETDASQTLTLRWTKSDETDVFTTGRALDTSKRQYARQGGRFTKRNYQIEYSGSEQIYLEALEADITVGVR